MKRTKRTIVAALLLFAWTLTAQSRDLGYDPDADPFEQYRQAVTNAAAQNKLVLVIAGGDWCYWCHVLNRFVQTNDDIEARLNETFVVMKVYVGPDNYNEMFFAQLPRAYGAPHFWVVSSEREVLASQPTAKLEQGRRGYDKSRFLAFIEQWHTPASTPARHATASTRLNSL